MLLEFRVRNYRSIRDEQTLSLVASNDQELAHTHLTQTGLKNAARAVRSAVVFGANASGKTTLLFALNYMRTVIEQSATSIQPGHIFNVQPFKLDETFRDEPSAFELTFMLDGVRHQYSFEMTPQRIVSESLSVYRTAKPTVWFSRYLREDGESYGYEFSAHLKGSRSLWQKSTRANALFLSTAAQLNSELLSPVFRKIVNGIVFFPAGTALDHGLTTSLLDTDKGQADVRRFLSAADTGISNVQVEHRKGFRQQLVFSTAGETQVSREESEFALPVFQHVAPKGSAKFELHEESQGTQRLYGLVAPVLDILENGRTLVVDELDSSLHTLLVRRLISMFHDSSLNRNGAQLIFSTHDTSLLDHTLFRRDQIWFTEKNADQATQVYPLTDFSVRKQELWGRNYLMGRYGAVPFFSEFSNLLKQMSFGHDVSPVG